MIPWPDGPGVVCFAPGNRVRGRGLRNPRPLGLAPDHGLYLQARDPGPFPWTYRWVRWPDFRTPSEPEDAVDALREAWARSFTERVEIACSGGVGRTGTALAALAVLSGVEPHDAVRWIRDRYHRRAVETPWQRRWVLRAGFDQARPPAP